VMGPERLARSMFPLGDVASKDETRAEAAARGLSVSAKPDSYDICFVADGDTQGFLRARLGSQPGEVVDTTGAVVGEHDGAYAYTVGQRRGLSLGRPAADGKPRYVLSVEPVSNRVVVGSADELLVDVVDADRAVWFSRPADAFDCSVQVRAHGVPVPARALVRGDGVEVTLVEGLRGVAPGQSLVVYDGTQVLGQATVTASRRASVAAR
jgi:tRNA-uridine 2-sulfurtransferase